MATLTQSIKAIPLMVIRGYRLLLRPFLPLSCRFYPSCSAYAIEAIEKRGCFCGLILSLLRLLRCHPWHPGGHDPVPKRGFTHQAK